MITNLDRVGDPASAANANTAGASHARPDPANVCGHRSSNLGNTTPDERTALLTEIATTLRPDDHFLVSVDLQKPAPVFDTCYNDPPHRSAFARFRLNHLTLWVPRTMSRPMISAFTAGRPRGRGPQPAQHDRPQ